MTDRQVRAGTNRSTFQAQLRAMHAQRNRQRLWILSVILLVALFILILAVVFLAGRQNNRPELAFINRGKVDQSIRVSGVVVRQEQVLASPADGIVMPAVQEGHRVDKQGVILKVVAADQAEKLQALDTVDENVIRQFKTLSSSRESIELNQILRQVNRQLKAQIRQMRSDLIAQNWGSIAIDQEILHFIMQNQRNQLTEVIKRYPELDDLMTQRIQILGDIDRAAQSLVADQSALVSYQSDGQEQQITPAHLDQVHSSLFDQWMAQSSRLSPLAQNTTAGAPICRIVKDIRQYFVLEILGQGGVNFKVDDVVKLEVDRVGITISQCIVQSVQTEEDRTLVVLRSDQAVESLLNLRQISGSIHLDSVAGLSIPKSALKKDQLDADTGRVKILDASYVREETVHILNEDETHYIVEPFDKNSLISEGRIVVLNPDQVKVGEVVG